MFNNANRAGENPFGPVELTLAAGDFTNDGAHDLAVGLPLADVTTGTGTFLDAGAVFLLHGIVGTVQTGGLTTTGVASLTESNANFIPNHNEQFGTALAVGDFNGDGADDLAVGTPLEDVVGKAGTLVQDAGFVAVFSRGTTLHGIYTQLPLGHNPQRFDNFGAVLASADFNGDGAEDLAIGTPGDTVAGVAGAGSVAVLYGILGAGLPRPASAGLPQINGTVQLLTQETANIADVAEAGDHFGATLTAWNFGRSSHADLIIGVPDEDILVSLGGSLSGIQTENRADAGLLHAIYGSSAGLTATNSSAFSQGSVGIPDTVEAGDRFGSAVY